MLLNWCGSMFAARSSRWSSGVSASSAGESGGSSALNELERSESSVWCERCILATTCSTVIDVSRPKADVEDDHRALDPLLEDLEAGERREQDLLLVRVLREPRDLGAAIDDPHLDLEEQPRLAAARRVVRGDLAVGRRRHERELDTAADILLVRLSKLLGEHAAADAAVHLARRRQLAQLDDRRVDRVQRRRVGLPSVIFCACTLSGWPSGSLIARRLPLYLQWEEREVS